MAKVNTELKAHDPVTAAEWQEAVEAATFFRALDSAIKYGLMSGPAINVERCEELIARGKDRGIGCTKSLEELTKEFVEAR